MKARDTPGAFDPLHDVELKDGEFHGDSSRGQLHAAFENFAQQGPQAHLSVFFHGGLVSQEEGLKTAGKLIGGYAKSGAYPMFVIWNSDLESVIDSHIRPHHGNSQFVGAANRAVKTVVAKMAVGLDQKRPTARAKAPRLVPRKAEDLLALEDLAAYAEPFDRALAAHPGVQIGASGRELQAFAKWLPAGKEAVRGTRLAFRPRNLAGPRNPLARVFARINSGHGHGVYTTVIEELFIALGLDQALGDPVWGQMKHFIDESFVGRPTAGGSAFLDELCRVWKPGMRITLIGHSAGAILVQRFIEALDARLPAASSMKVEVIFIAAALSFERMRAGFDAFKRRVTALRAFGLSDKTESSYWEVFPVYNKSLLYIVSSLCENDPEADKPLVGMQRYWSNRRPYLGSDIRAITGEISPLRIVWAPTGSGAAEGYRSHANRHGRFPEDPDTNESVCHVLKLGF